MKAPARFIARGGRYYAGKPRTRLFAILSFIGLWFLALSLIALSHTGWPPDPFSSQFWFCVFLAVIEFLFLILTLKLALTEKTIPESKQAYDMRKLY